MKRIVVPELLDSDAGTPGEIAANLADLRMINRRFGGVRAMSALLRTVAEKRRLKEIRWLDAAGASGDLASDVQKSLAGCGIVAHPVILDRATSHLGSAWPSVCGDVTALPFAGNSFDVVSSSLFAHHLDPEQIVAFAQEGLRVARHAFVINDLVRHPLHLALAYAGWPLYRSRLSRHDAPASVRRAYTRDEMKDMLAAAGVMNTEIVSFYLFRMGVIAWKQPNTI